MAERSRTIVEYFAEHESYRCGYCGNSDTNYSHGMWAHSLNVQDYQDLLDRGWRRSGKYTYKPTMNMTCCPQYPIRCEVLDFKIRKSHKKVLKRVNKYLIHGIKPSKDEDDIEEESKSKTQTEDLTKPTSSEVESVIDPISTEEKTKSQPSISDNQREEKPTTSDDKSNKVSNKNDRKQSGKPRTGSGRDPTKPQCKKAKELRQERKLAKLAAQGVKTESSETNSGTSKKQESKTLEELLSEPHNTKSCAHKLEIRLVRSYPESTEFLDSLEESHAVYHRYQMSIHGDPPDKPALKQYKRFLVDSPLEEEREEDGLPDGYGSFHQQYLLDGKIICVGVLDILPSLVSSKYLYYDPDYSFLSLGTYSALQEIAFIRSLHTYSEKMLYYYMGFYIHSCPKMKYKGQYFPSYLLCPETYTWHPVDKCSPKLDQNKFSRFADEGQVDIQGNIDLSSVLVLHSRQPMNYKIYKSLSRGKNEDEEEVKEYASLVGKKCTGSLLLFRK